MNGPRNQSHEILDITTGGRGYCSRRHRVFGGIYLCKFATVLEENNRDKTLRTSPHQLQTAAGLKIFCAKHHSSIMLLSPEWKQSLSTAIDQLSALLNDSQKPNVIILRHNEKHLLYWAVKRFNAYLFTIAIDNDALFLTSSSKITSGAICRYRATVDSFNYTIIHRNAKGCELATINLCGRVQVM
ncbi:hypothetical protein T265_11188 [Opisthorchis viverrini]|uniref:Uncharacterized protein n=1 Tax=Opisthorchis viverrini TaxID=6198 RepID=A0A074Z3X8_OPIVI|nr:hypothetical protein T265_11188 [Opisthorchis viverrini]KER20202.1 hypothetical protein T265_11188 [Opisthorchis viverrini]